MKPRILLTGLVALGFFVPMSATVSIAAAKIVVRGAIPLSRDTHPPVLINSRFRGSGDIAPAHPGKLRPGPDPMATPAGAAPSRLRAYEPIPPALLTRQAQTLNCPVILQNVKDLRNDIAALALLVTDAANSSQDDLQTIMAGIKAINDAKASWRNIANALNNIAADNAGASQVGNAPPKIQNLPVMLQNVKDLQNDIDSMNEVSEMTSLRLQMAMDRRSKFFETLSNIIKKISDTDSSIIQNIK